MQIIQNSSYLAHIERMELEADKKKEKEEKGKNQTLYFSLKIILFSTLKEINYLWFKGKRMVSLLVNW